MSKELNIDRRSFVKASALAGMAAAFGVSAAGSLVETKEAHAEESSETKVVKSLCHGCIARCPCLVHVKNGVAVKIEGDPAGAISKGSFCLKGMNQIQTMYSPRRILHPIKRAGERGQNEWEVISWDEALVLAAD